MSTQRFIKSLTFSTISSTSSGTVRTFSIPDGNYTISGLDAQGTVVYTVTNDTLEDNIIFSGPENIENFP